MTENPYSPPKCVDLEGAVGARPTFCRSVSDVTVARSLLEQKCKERFYRNMSLSGFTAISAGAIAHNMVVSQPDAYGVLLHVVGLGTAAVGFLGGCIAQIYESQQAGLAHEYLDKLETSFREQEEYK